MPGGRSAALDGFDTALVLGGGNALGAYHLGACETLLDAGIAPSWYLGTSIGAVVAAILVGNPPETRLDRLRTFWEKAGQAGASFASGWLPEELRSRLNNDHALSALLLGRPGLFGARFPGLWSLLPFMPPDRALRDQRPLARTLARLIDFERLNNTDLRLSIITIDMESGEEAWFDNWRHGIGPEHLLAATALAPLFAPVEIGGRLLCDAGFGNNLPLDRAFRESAAHDLLCIAVDLYSLSHGRPSSLDETVARVQDLAFATQSKKAIAAVRRERDLMRMLDPDSPSAILAHLAYRAPGHQRSLKPLDYSRVSLAERIVQGRLDMTAMLARLPDAPRTEALATVARDGGSAGGGGPSPPPEAG